MLYENNPLLGCSGRFRYSPFFDVTLSEQFRIVTEVRNFRIVQVPVSDSSRRVVAVSGDSRPHPVGIYDVNSKQQICQCLGHSREIWGLTSLKRCETISSNPIIVSGGYGDSQILLFDATNGSKLGQLIDPPKYTWRLLHVREWQNPDVFVGTSSRNFGVRRYDLVRKLKIGEYSGHTNAGYGLSGIVSRNLLISASVDATARLWSRDDYYACQSEIKLSDSALSCCSLSNNLIVVGLNNGRVEVYDVRRLSGSVGMTQIGQGASVWDMAVIDENRVVCGCYDGTLAVIEPSKSRVSAKTKLPSYVLGVCALSPSLDEFEGEDELERWEFGVKMLLEGSVSLVRLHGRQEESPILVSCWMLESV